MSAAAAELNLSTHEDVLKKLCRICGNIKSARNFRSLSLLRCGPDNNRTKENRKTIKIKKKESLRNKNF